MAFTSETVKVFLEVLDSGSFSAAARRLKRVPSAISMSISQLEAELDMQLFDRSAREAIPTAAARALEPKARQAQQQLRELQTQALQLHQGLEKRLTLAIAPELLSAAWNGPLATLAQEFPALEVEVRSEPQADALRLLHEGAVQIALVFERPNLDERERFQEFGSELLVAVAAPNYPELKAYGGPIRQEHLMNMRQILVGSGNVTKADPGVMDVSIKGEMIEGAEVLGIPYIQLASGASHDAAAFAAAGVPTQMLFIRNANGSHNPDEAMRISDFMEATRLLTWWLSNKL